MRVSVNPSDGTWTWADFGGSPSSGKKADGGGCLDMVRRLGGFTSNAEAMAELERIAASHGIAVINEESEASRRRAVSEGEAGIEILKVSDTFSRKALRLYFEQRRGIPVSLLSRYCKQVSYRPKSNTSVTYYAAGFPNNAEGFALRGTGKKAKRNYLSGISTFTPDGTFTPEGVVSASKCVVFEGFLDFLSYLAWRGVEAPGMDACVLNSTSMVAWAKDWILSHDVVRTFFDNDEAGDGATSRVEKWCREAGKDYKDGREAYKSHNDINEAWTAELDRRKGKAEGMKIK